MHSILKGRVVRALGGGRGHRMAVLLVGVPLLWMGLFGPLSSDPPEARANAFTPDPPDCDPDGSCDPCGEVVCDNTTWEPDCVLIETGPVIFGTLWYYEWSECEANLSCPTFPTDSQQHQGLEWIPVCLGSTVSFLADAGDEDQCYPNGEVLRPEPIVRWLQVNDPDGVLAPVSPCPCICINDPDPCYKWSRVCGQIVRVGEFNVTLDADDFPYCGADDVPGMQQLKLLCGVPCPTIAVGLDKDVVCPGETLKANVTFTYPDFCYPNFPCPCMAGVQVNWSVRKAVKGEEEAGVTYVDCTKKFNIRSIVAGDLCTVAITPDVDVSGDVWIFAGVDNCTESKGVRLTVGCESCGAGGCAPGAIKAKVGSLDVAFPLGHGTDGMSAGRLWIYAEEPDSTLATPAALHYDIEDDLRDDISVDRDGSGNLLGVSVPDTNVDVHTMDDVLNYVTQLWFYRTNPGTPFVVWELKQSKADSSNLVITKIVDEQAVETYTYDGTQGTRDWTLTRADDVGTVQTEAVAWTAETGGLKREYSVEDAGSNETYHVEEFYPDALDNEIWTTRIVDPDPGGAQLLTTRTFCDYTYGDYEGYLESQVNPDGSWEWYAYSDQGGGHTVTVYRPWLDEAPPGSAPSGTPSDMRTSITQYDAMGHVTLREEYAAGVLVHKTEYTNSYDANGWLTQRTESRHGDGDYCLETVTYYDDEEPEKERPALVTHPDGTLTHYAYQDAAWTPPASNPSYTVGSGSYHCTTVTRCRSLDQEPPNDPVGENNLSTAEITIADANGRTLLRDSLVYAGGAWVIVGRTTYAYDELGRVIDTYRLDPADNSELGHTNTYWEDCCGDRTVTDETGVATHYEYDILGRPTLTWRYVDDAEYAVPEYVYTVYTYGFASGSPFVRAAVQDLEESPTIRTATEREYDLAGRVLNDKTLDANLDLVYQTTYGYGTGSGGGRLVTATRPDGATEITEYYRDGRTESVSGTGGVLRAYYYGAFTGGLQSAWTLTGTANPLLYDSWLRRTITSHDMLGRTVEEVRPAYPSGDLTTSYTYYGDTGVGAGQLQQVVTSDGSGPVQAPTAYEYDEMSNMVRSGLDLDGGGLDEGNSNSTDRITETRTTYESDGGWWRVRKTWVYDEGDASPAILQTSPLSKMRERLTGFGSGEMRKTERYDAYNTLTTSLTSVDQDNVITEETDTPESSTHATRATLGGLLVSSTTQTGVTYTYGYDGIGRQVSVADSRRQIAGSPPVPCPTFTEYSPYGVAAVYTTADGTPGGSRVTESAYQYDAQTARLSAVRVLDADGPSYLYTRYDYTDRGEVQHVWGEVPQPVEYDYDGFGQRVTMTTYRDDAGWTGSSWPGSPPAGDTTTWVYDDATGLLEEKEYADEESVTYTYTSDGKLKSRTWARGVMTGYGYTPAGDMDGIDYNCANPEQPVFDIDFDYDRRGRMLEVTDTADGTDHEFDYSGWPLYVTETISDGPFGRSFAVLRETSGSTGGRLAGLYIGTDPVEYQANYIYDSNSGRLARVNGPGLPAGGGNSGAWYTYHTGSDLVHETQFKAASTVLAKTVRAYEGTRDLVDYVENIWDPDGPVSISKYDYTNNALGLRETIVHSGAAFSPSFTQSLDYNARNELTSSTRSDDTDLNRAYSYDPIGNRIDLDEGATPLTTTYATNELNQYEQTYAASAGAPAVQKSSYDEDGNLIQAYLVGDVNGDGTFNNFDTTPFVYAVQHTEGEFENEYPSGCYWCADLTGDGSVNTFDISPFTGLFTSGPTVGYEWDAENRLVAVTPLAPMTGARKVLFKYDYLGRRIEKAVYDWDDQAEDWEAEPTEVRRFVWSGWLMLLELDGSDDVIRKYTWGLDLAGQHGGVNSLESAGGIGGLLAVYDADEEDDYVYLYDANGNVGQVVAWEAGYGGADDDEWHADRLVAAYEYDPYGAVVAQSGDYAAANPFRFSTKYWDDETGLGYWGKRYYDPRTGRWMSRDPIGEEGGLNLYAYVRNASTISADALGLDILGIDDVDRMIPPGDGPRKGCCGPDITRSLQQVVSRVETHFSGLSEPAKFKACTGMIWPGTNVGKGTGWDIEELSLWGTAGGCNLFNVLQRRGCGTLDCAGSVQVNGGCYRAGEVNYVLWGTLFRLCHEARSAWKMSCTIVQHCEATPLGTIIKTTKRCDMEDSTGTYLGPALPWPRDRWDLARAVDLVFLHREWTAPRQGVQPNTVGSGSAACRAHWTHAGYHGYLSAPPGCQVNCGMACCRQPLNVRFTVTFGPETAP